MLRQLAISAVMLGLWGGFGGTAAQARDYWKDLYKHERKAVNKHFDYRQDLLRDQYKATRQWEKDAWKGARRYAPPHERRWIDEQYRHRRKALQQDFKHQRKQLNAWEKQTRDALRHGHRYYGYPGHLPPWL